MKPFELFINGRSLINIPVTQNETGRFYRNDSNGAYYKPLLKDFDTAVPPVGYTTYTNGSHSLTNLNGVNVLAQRAIDFAEIGDMTCSQDLDVTRGRGNLGIQSFVGIETSVGLIDLVHQFPLTGVGLVKAGTPICRNAWDHLHIYLYGGKIRDIILGTNYMATFNPGDRIELTTDVNLREGTSSLAVSRGVYKKGSQGVVQVSSRSDMIKDGHEWVAILMDQDLGKGRDGFMAVKRLSDGAMYAKKIEPPKPPVTNFVTKEEYEKNKAETDKRVKTLEGKMQAVIDGLGTTASAGSAVK